MWVYCVTESEWGGANTVAEAGTHTVPIDQGCQSHLKLRPEKTKCYSEGAGRTNKKTLLI